MTNPAKILLRSVIEALGLFLSCSNSVLTNTSYIQTDDTAQESHMSCSYFDIAIAGHDSKPLVNDFPSQVWKRFMDDAFFVWTHGIAKLFYFLDYLNSNDDAEKIKFTMQTAHKING